MSINRSKQFFICAKVYDKRGMLLSVGWNSYSKTHPRQAHWAKVVNRPLAVYLHAESMAIFRLRPSQQKKAYRIEIARFAENGEPRIAKPCEICSKIIEAYGIQEVVYSTDEGFSPISYDEWNLLRVAVAN